MSFWDKIEAEAKRAYDRVERAGYDYLGVGGMGKSRMWGGGKADTNAWRRDDPEGLEARGYQRDADYARQQRGASGYYDETLDEFGYSDILPDASFALTAQHRADAQAARRNDMLAQQAGMTQREGLGNLQTYRPGGASALTSGYYTNMSNLLLERRTDAPDLLGRYREQIQADAKKEAKRAQNKQLAVAAGGALLTAATAGMAGPAAAAGVAGAAGAATQAAAPGAAPGADAPGAAAPGAAPGAEGAGGWRGTGVQLTPDGSPILSGGGVPGGADIAGGGGGGTTPLSSGPPSGELGGPGAGAAGQANNASAMMARSEALSNAYNSAKYMIPSLRGFTSSAYIEHESIAIDGDTRQLMHAQDWRNEIGQSYDYTGMNRGATNRETMSMMPPRPRRPEPELQYTNYQPPPPDESGYPGRVGMEMESQRSTGMPPDPAYGAMRGVRSPGDLGPGWPDPTGGAPSAMDRIVDTLDAERGRLSHGLEDLDVGDVVVRLESEIKEEEERIEKHKKLLAKLRKEGKKKKKGKKGKK
jgi:hypothetical protein